MMGSCIAASTATGDAGLAASASPRFVKISEAKLFASEPNPSWFGNPGNPKADPAWTNANWLKSRFHFSFAEYRNPRNSNFGVLRVMNDDLVQPKRGFGEHPHTDMEIVTYVVNGNLTHQDSMGNKGDVPRGGIQYMSAGTGVRHAEHNHGETSLRFIQCWVSPDRRGYEPNYGQFDGDAKGRLDKWQHLVSSFGRSQDKHSPTPVQVHQDVNMYVSELSAAAAGDDGVKRLAPFDLHDGRMAYLLCIEGSVTLGPAGGDGGGTSLLQHDAVEIYGGGAFSVANAGPGGERAHVLMFEMKRDPKGGRSDL